MKCLEEFLYTEWTLEINLPKIIEGGIGEIINDVNSGAVGLSAEGGAEDEEEE